MKRQTLIKMVFLATLLCGIIFSDGASSVTMNAEMTFFPMSGGEQLPLIYVEPQNETAGIGEIYQITVYLANVTNLFSLDIAFAWGSRVLEYYYHEVHIPWDLYGDGVLNPDASVLKDEYDLTAGTYRLMASSVGTTTPSFNNTETGPGVIFLMQFRVLQYGETDLHFTMTQLATRDGGDIPHETRDGYFYMPGLGRVPVASFTYSPAMPVINRTAIIFDATESYDPDGNDLALYIWDFGDGIRSDTSNKIIQHTYFKPGVVPSWVFDVRLSVLDSEGSQSKTVEKTIAVVHPMPVAKMTSWPPPNIRNEVYAVLNKNITFDASTSYDPDLEAGDPTGGIAEYKWDWADGTFTTTTEPVINRSYSSKPPEDPGYFGVYLQVEDNEGLKSSLSIVLQVYIVDSRDTEVTDLQVSPTMLPRGLNVTTDATVTNIGDAPEEFTATAYYNKTSLSAGAQWTKIEEKAVTLLQPSESRVLTFNWTTIDAQIDHYYYIMVNTTEVPHEMNPTNNMRVSDDAILVLRANPTASFDYSPAVPLPDEEVSFDASQSYDTDGTIVLYKWEFGDGTIKMYTGANLTAATKHTFAVPDSYNVTLTVIDNDGYEDSLTHWIDIQAYYPLDVSADVGAIHFNGEIAEFYVLVLRSGERINATQIGAGLYYSNGALYQDLTSNQRLVSTGLYRIYYSIPAGAPSGTYTLLVEAKYMRLRGTAIRSFLVSPTLEGWDALLVDIKDEIATIVVPNLGEIKANLTQIKATLARIEGSVGIISTSVGEIKTRLTLINATLTNVKDMIGTISSDLGEIRVLMNDINATLVEIVTDSTGEVLARLDYFLGTQGTITVKLEDIRARVTAIDNNVATVQSGVGTIQAGVGGVHGAVLYVTAVFSALAAIGAIVILMMSRKKGI